MQRQTQLKAKKYNTVRIIPKINRKIIEKGMTSNPKVSSFRINFYVIRSSINKNFLQKQKK
jgi:ribosomal protein L31E